MAKSRSTRNTPAPSTRPSPSIPPAPRRAPAISTTDLSQCKLDRDFTKLLDLKHEYHATFVKKLKRHVEFFHTWRELRESMARRELCVEQFLDIYGVEYWGAVNRSKYVMADSLTEGIEVRWPDNIEVLKEVLVHLVQKKAESMMKGRQTAGPEREPESSQPAAALATPPATAPETDVPGGTEYAPSTHHGEEEGEGEGQVEDEQNSLDEDEADGDLPRAFSPRRNKRSRTTPKAITSVSTTNDQSNNNDTSSLTSLTAESTCSETSNSIVTVPTALPVIDAFRKEISSNYHRDTYFLVTTDRTDAAPAWVEFKKFKKASSFLLDMGRERGLERDWWTPGAQMQLEGANIRSEADYVSAAQAVIVMASVKLEWSGDEILVRWGNDDDWSVAMQLIYKAWLAKELGLKLFDVFRVRVVLHIQG